MAITKVYKANTFSPAGDFTGTGSVTVEVDAFVSALGDNALEMNGASFGGPWTINVAGTVHSDLNAVGLTAAFASALGGAGISCNVVAGAYHDHLFVPVERADDAMRALRSLQRGADGSR